jgi:arsenate reductase-like glutaredoxin family protein
MADFKQSREVYVEQKYAKKEAADIDVGPRKPFGELTVKLDVDASDAITALKAIQREARKATQALREFESEASRLEAEVAKAKLEQLAALEHEQWAHWTRYMLDNLTEENIARWRRQIDTPYEELSEKEKESDRKWARKVLDVLHKDEVVAEKIASTNITINVPEIKADDKADVEKILKELTKRLREVGDRD